MTSRNPFKRRVPVHSVREYFSLPRNKRVHFGLYLYPVALPSSLLGAVDDGWEKWEQMIRKEFPVQWWFREYVFNMNSCIYTPYRRVCSVVRKFYYGCVRFIKPGIPRTRATIPRHKYIDISDAVLDVNFALLCDFWHEEVSAGCVDYTVDDENKKFYAWLESAVFWIEHARVAANKELDAALMSAYQLDKLDDSDRFSLYDKLQKHIDDTDTRILTEIVKYRSKLWT